MGEVSSSNIIRSIVSRRPTPFTPSFISASSPDRPIKSADDDPFAFGVDIERRSAGPNDGVISGDMVAMRFGEGADTPVTFGDDVDEFDKDKMPNDVFGDCVPMAGDDVADAEERGGATGVETVFVSLVADE